MLPLTIARAKQIVRHRFCFGLYRLNAARAYLNSNGFPNYH